jgi:hypothetical protein
LAILIGENFVSFKEGGLKFIQCMKKINCQKYGSKKGIKVEI